MELRLDQCSRQFAHADFCTVIGEYNSGDNKRLLLTYYRHPRLVCYTPNLLKQPKYRV